MKCGGIFLRSQKFLNDVSVKSMKFGQIAKIRIVLTWYNNIYFLWLMYCGLLGWLGHKRTSDKLKNDKKKIFS